MRATVIVLDSLGVGELPDAGEYGDKGANTLGHIQDIHPLNIPNMRRLGLGNIDGAADGRLKIDNPQGIYGRLAERSAGKDTINGHWEIAGIETRTPMKTFPNGFPKPLLEELSRQIGRGYIGNCVASGTEIIERLGDEHEKTGDIIVYTSADSVFQVAANTAVIPLEELYDICAKARKLLVGENLVGRVIARPYVKDASGKRTRTSDRHDYALHPPERTMLNILMDQGLEVYSIGKIRDIFNGYGISRAVHTEDNDDGITKTIEALQQDFNGLIFTNLVDFDSKYGHRNNTEGYAKAIEAFDRRLPEIEGAMRDDDILIMCSDHGNDPEFPGFNHTREYIFCLATGKMLKKGVNLGTRDSFADIGATVVDILTDNRETLPIGNSFKTMIL